MLRPGAIATMTLGAVLSAHSAGASSPWLREHATWLQQHTAAASNGVLGLSEPGWRPDCTLVVDSNVREQRARVYALSALRRVEPDGTRAGMIRMTFAPESALGVVRVQSLFDDRDRVITRIREYAAACGATGGTPGA